MNPMSMPVYFHHVSFIKRSSLEKVQYILFYVTCVSQLRNDMVPKILAQRINDQIDIYNADHGYSKNSGKFVKEVSMDDIIQACQEGCQEGILQISTFKDIRDRDSSQSNSPEEIPYMLSHRREVKLKNEFDKYFDKIQERNKNHFNIFWKIVIMIVLLCLSIAYILDMRNTYDLSWKEYTERIKYCDKSNGERGLYILNYITNVIKFREDMTPGVIANRINDVNLNYFKMKDSPKADEKEIENFFLRTKYAYPSYERSGAYTISADGAKKISEELTLKPPKEVNLKWIISNMSPSTFLGFLGLFIPFFAGGFVFGGFLATKK